MQSNSQGRHDTPDPKTVLTDGAPVSIGCDLSQGVDKLQGLRCKVATVDEWLSSADAREDVIGAIEQGASKFIRSESREEHTELNPVRGAVDLEETTTNVLGVVTDCFRLNVRKEPFPDGEVLTIIDVLSEVMVDLDASSEAFYKICTEAGIEGFCMKKHIALRR